VQVKDAFLVLVWVNVVVDATGQRVRSEASFCHRRLQLELLSGGAWFLLLVSQFFSFGNPSQVAKPSP